MSGTGGGTSGVMCTMKHASEIQIKSNGNFMSFIQNGPIGPLSLINNMPDFGGRWLRPERPLVRSADVIANSTMKDTRPRVTEGVSGWKLVDVGVRRIAPFSDSGYFVDSEFVAV